MRPFFPYYGSTWNRARYLPAPQFDLVREPFAGGAGYSLFYNCPRVQLMDKDPVIFGVWDYLIKVTTVEIAHLPEMPDVGDSVDNYSIPQEAKWLISFWLNRGSAQPKKSRTVYSARTDKGQLNWGKMAKLRIMSQLYFLQGWSVYLGSYEQFSPSECTWLIDPPYQEKGKFYKEKFSEYVKLADWCRSIPGQRIVLEGANANWLPFQSLGEFKTSKGKSEEKVWLS